MGCCPSSAAAADNSSSVVATNRTTLSPSGKLVAVSVTSSGSRSGSSPQLSSGSRSDLGLFQKMQTQSTVGVSANSAPTHAFSAVAVPSPPSQISRSATSSLNQEGRISLNDEAFLPAAIARPDQCFSPADLAFQLTSTPAVASDMEPKPLQGQGEEADRPAIPLDLHQRISLPSTSTDSWPLSADFHNSVGLPPTPASVRTSAGLVSTPPPPQPMNLLVRGSASNSYSSASTELWGASTGGNDDRARIRRKSSDVPNSPGAGATPGDGARF